ncbi:Vegetative incompatibility protein HET-E-1 [Fusarium oxysporum f. sp. albedinis]|nr:Vegetative incompatibility protein HET-E-1 [Fusarium oxysporum f. sp. albedinis]
MSGITIKNAPSFHVVTGGNSKDVVYSGLTLYSVSSSSNVAHNTDGFDIGPASYVTVENTKITNDDDCVVLKPGASYVTTTGVTCVGSHGLSIGSLSGGAGSNDIVTNSIFKDCTMIGSTKAAGIKYYPGGSTHGTGSVSNVTWQDITCDTCDYAIQISTCYMSTPAACSANPSTGKISGVMLWPIWTVLLAVHVELRSRTLLSWRLVERARSFVLIRRTILAWLVPQASFLSTSGDRYYQAGPSCYSFVSENTTVTDTVHMPPHLTKTNAIKSPMEAWNASRNIQQRLSRVIHAPAVPQQHPAKSSPAILLDRPFKAHVVR